MPRGRGYTKVDLRHLLEDLRDAYPGSLEETILAELVANSLDAGASRIRCSTDPATSSFRLEDDGRGMVWKEMRQFHNLAASTKTRGEGIGFAGVGIKLALLAAREVLTESRRGRSHTASRWHLASREFAPYERIEPAGLTAEHGTAVTLQLHHGLSPLLDPGFLEHILRLHYQPLLDPQFGPALTSLYPRGVRFEIDGRALEPHGLSASEHARIEVKIERQRKPSGFGYLQRHALPLPEHLRGVAISTYGKVIRRGWDWLGILPAAPDRVTGIVEVPALAQSLTLNKGDFVRSGARGAIYLMYRRAIQEAVQAQLTGWGDARDVAQDERRRIARPLERDLERVLEGLSEEFPLLRSLIERQQSGQRRIALPGRGGEEAPAAKIEMATGSTMERGAAGESPAPPDEPPEAPPGGNADGVLPVPPVLGDDRAAPPAPPAVPAATDGEGASSGQPVRARRYGLSLQFEARPGDPELGRLIENTVWINTAHPAWQRAETSRSTGYHVAVAVAMALAPLASGGASVHRFLTDFLGQWGDAVRVRRDGRSRAR